MALTKNDAVPYGYTRGAVPEDTRLRLFVADELRKVELAIKRLEAIQPQVAVKEPEVKYHGMIRHARAADWDPLSGGVDAWVWWNGSAWVAL